QSYALKTPLKIPLIYGIDAVHGNNNIYGATIFPHNIGLGATRDTALVRKIGHATAVEVAGTGIDWAFAPCIAVPQDERWGRTYEGFGEMPGLVSEMGYAEIEGLQGNVLGGNNTSVLACAKHFVGDGGTTGGVNEGNTQVSEKVLREIHLKPYEDAIKAGVGSIMVSYSSWNGQKMHGNKYLLTTVLKGQMGFKGFLVSDWAAINQLGPDYKEDIKKSINAGLDMIMVPDKYVEFINDLTQLVKDNEVPMSRINDAVRRILRVKFQMKLFQHPYTDKSLTAQIGSDAHRELARQAVRESMVLLKNKNNVLPISKNIKKLFVAGSHADNLGYQCGGWTITWQGGSGNTTKGTTMLQGIRNEVSSSTKVTYSKDGTGVKGSDFAVVVVGEKPYAEGQGDRKDLHLSQEDLNTIENVRKSGVPYVVVLISGRPMIVTNVIDQAPAFIAAWLPGSEGEGVADVLFGDYAPTGKLPASWPKSMSQIPINKSDTANYNPLFPYGYGLTYQQ
ncbi:MAG TPA: glycoside hydrolase family 3 N-terminal domain-containing protein, partial [Balneolales bacterium]|nr:glycoside hydrolase family 3 N-terminal domain-containing protein [Balneolales bacterium]